MQDWGIAYMFSSRAEYHTHKNICCFSLTCITKSYLPDELELPLSLLMDEIRLDQICVLLTSHVEGEGLPDPGAVVVKWWLCFCSRHLEEICIVLFDKEVQFSSFCRGPEVCAKPHSPETMQRAKRRPWDKLSSIQVEENMLCHILVWKQFPWRTLPCLLIRGHTELCAWRLGENAHGMVFSPPVFFLQKYYISGLAFFVLLSSITSPITKE